MEISSSRRVIFESSNFDVKAVRELSDAEQAKIEEYTKVGAHARNRFKLFAILRRNYEQWGNYVRSLLTPTKDLVEDEMLELDRLLLNFQSSAKSVIDHFRQDWIQVHRGSPDEVKFQECLQHLESSSWAFAFFQDLRNFTQHCGLPVGNYSRNVDASSVRLSIEADSRWLVERYKKWDKSRLKEGDGRLDLINLTDDYYIRLSHDFANFVAQAFAPTLFDAHNFFAGLANEVSDRFPGAEYKIVQGIRINGNKLTFDFGTPPANLLGWLGISVAERPVDGCNQTNEEGTSHVL
ncbi:hypothetical protein [Verrucomicrobium spinosum]|uniref:hypothetical protein n=1 Tax=Verrucomicrobium spinosum TaxID=2736 RepID=UPI001C473BC1|nr:hypothetical protein [Verrucomicrobium spinosum]